MHTNNNDVKECYREETLGRRYHTPIVTKHKDRTEEPPSEVQTMSLNKPMVYKEFKNLSKDMQKMYLRHIVKTYNPTQNDVYTMLGCSTASFYRCLQALELKGLFPRGKTPRTKAEKNAWKNFLGNTEPTETQTTTTDCTPDAVIESFKFSQHGPFNADKFIQKIMAFIKNGDDYNIHVTVTTPTKKLATLNPFSQYEGVANED